MKKILFALILLAFQSCQSDQESTIPNADFFALDLNKVEFKIDLDYNYY